MSSGLTDHQIRLLKVIDHVRWGEEEHLDAFKYHLLRRAIGQKDEVLEFELEQAVNAYTAYATERGLKIGDRLVDAPAEGTSERSPWMGSWDVTPEQYDAAGTVDVPIIAGMNS